MACVEGGLEVGDAVLKTSEVVGGDAPNALSDGVGEVFLDEGILGDVVAEVGSVEVERVRRGRSRDLGVRVSIRRMLPTIWYP